MGPDHLDVPRCPLSLFCLGFVLAFSPQVLAWHAIFGEWILVPQGEFMHWTKPYLVDVVFSPRYGLLGFSPILYLCVIGLSLGVPLLRNPLVGLSVTYFVASVYVNASAGDWYAGATFSSVVSVPTWLRPPFGGRSLPHLATNERSRSPESVFTILESLFNMARIRVHV